MAIHLLEKLSPAPATEGRIMRWHRLWQNTLSILPSIARSHP